MTGKHSGFINRLKFFGVAASLFSLLGATPSTSFGEGENEGVWIVLPETFEATAAKGASAENELDQLLSVTQTPILKPINTLYRLLEIVSPLIYGASTGNWSEAATLGTLSLVLNSAAMDTSTRAYQMLKENTVQLDKIGRIAEFPGVTDVTHLSQVDPVPWWKVLVATEWAKLKTTGFILLRTKAGFEPEKFEHENGKPRKLKNFKLRLQLEGTSERVDFDFLPALLTGVASDTKEGIVETIDQVEHKLRDPGFRIADPTLERFLNRDGVIEALNKTPSRLKLSFASTVIGSDGRAYRLSRPLGDITSFDLGAGKTAGFKASAARWLVYLLKSPMRILKTAVMGSVKVVVNLSRTALLHTEAWRQNAEQKIKNLKFEPMDKGEKPERPVKSCAALFSLGGTP